MINKELKKKECLFEIVDDLANGMDIYNHNGFFWLINTKELKWMIEFTKDKTLWYNYNIFKSLFKAMSLDVLKNQEYITEWFESRFLKPEMVEDTIQNGVKHTRVPSVYRDKEVEDTIQNGVKHTRYATYNGSSPVKDTIQNGVKRTDMDRWNGRHTIHNTIQNWVKRTRSNDLLAPIFVADDIQYGVKETIPTLRRTLLGVDDILQNGVKHTEYGDWLDGDKRIGDITQNGVKRTKGICGKREGRVGNTIKNGLIDL